MVHIIALSVQHDYTKESEQYIWLEKDLKISNNIDFFLFFMDFS